MRIYSENIMLFIEKCEGFLKEIIRKETPYQLAKSRFKIDNYSYPLHLVVFTDSQKLGYFDPHSYQIGLHQSLMYSVKDSVLKDILRHEFAHYLCYIETANLHEQHGELYKSTCRRLGWGAAISKASLNIELANQSEGELHNEKLIAKIKALLKLAESDNVHEAELATIKANQLLLKHNLSSLDLHNNFLYIKSILTSKRRSAKLSAIYDILKHFLIRPVFVYGKGQVSLEVSGARENIELAEYVANFLDQELERLWQMQTQLKGLRAKNSFFLGIARGYENKVAGLTKSFSPAEQTALIKINQQLDTNIDRFYRRLSSVARGGSIDSSAYESGKKSGSKLNINPGIKNKSKNLLLNWRNS